MADDEKETIILRCPLCSQEHSYAISIRRSAVLGYMVAIRSWEPHKKEFTRLFTCPTKNEPFKARFTLLEWPLESLSVQEEELSKKEEKGAESGQKPQERSAKKTPKE